MNIKSKEHFLETHLAFILTMLITYIFGGLFIAFEYTNSSENLLKIMLDTIIPTTITYVLGCVLVNLVELLQQSEKSHFLFNILTCLFVCVYAMIYTLYLFKGYSVGWLIAELILTALLLVLNICCYKEKFRHRNHGLV